MRGSRRPKPDDVRAAAPPLAARPPKAEQRVGGSPEALASLRTLLRVHPRWPRSLRAPSGLLLHGPPGCGKTHLVVAVAAESRAHCEILNGADVYAAPCSMRLDWCFLDIE